VHEREGLIRRIRQIRRAAGAADKATTRIVDREQDRISALEARIAHLEALVQGLQDSVHRESSRHGKRIAELETRVQPGELGKALSEDARARGL
jgi:uncharacterized coiled-coil protein SlyX